MNETLDAEIRAKYGKWVDYTLTTTVYSPRQDVFMASCSLSVRFDLKEEKFAAQDVDELIRQVRFRR